jgi:phytoene desaturase
MTSILVIGAGIGGIATAARLARYGYQVTVLEKNERAGGRCDRLVKDGHHFDTGATLYLIPELYAQTFADLGERVDDHLDLRRVDPTYRLYFRDGSTLDLTSDLNVMQAQLEAIEPGSFGAYLRYVDEGYRHYRLSLDHLVGREFRSLPEFLNLKNLQLLFKLKALVKHYDNVAGYFSDPRLKIAFSFQNMYMGISPYEAPATYSLLQYTELADGVWFPAGGMYRVVEALIGIAEKWGVRFMYDARVERIDVDGRRAAGVTLADGRQMQAEVVVANADLPYVYGNLLPNDGTADRLERKTYTCSAMMFYWGLGKQYPQIGPHNLFLPGDPRQSFNHIFKDFRLPDDPGVYVHAPMRVDPSLAPEGQDTLTVAVLTGHINHAVPQDWGTVRNRARQIVLRRLADIGAVDLEEHIKFEVSYTPRDWESRYNLTRGSSHGLSHHLMQMAYLRPRNRHKRYRNLYFVGASTHPGTGMPTVLVSARHAAERIFQEVGVPQSAFMMTPAVTVQRDARLCCSVRPTADTNVNERNVTMTDTTAALARSITSASSKQSFYTARLLVDRDLVDDCCRAYAYFRWADDIVDADPANADPSQSREKRISFITRQRDLIERLYRGERPSNLTPEEEIIADLISRDKGEDSGLRSFIRNFAAILEFDADRKGRLVSQSELMWYSSCLGKAVTDCIQYFIGHGHPYPTTEDRYLAATAAHMTHMLRDMVQDIPEGFINIPREYLEAHGISPEDVDSPPFRAWVRDQVEQARALFRAGKLYLDKLDVLRCKIAGHWYCARFEGVLDTIERDNYVLRTAYEERRKPSTWTKMAQLGVSITLGHITQRGLSGWDRREVGSRRHVHRNP